MPLSRPQCGVVDSFKLPSGPAIRALTIERRGFSGNYSAVTRLVARIAVPVPSSSPARVLPALSAGGTRVERLKITIVPVGGVSSDANVGKNDVSVRCRRYGWLESQVAPDYR